MRIALLSLFVLSLGLGIIGCHNGGTPGHHDRAPQKTSVKIEQP